MVAVENKDTFNLAITREELNYLKSFFEEYPSHYYNSILGKELYKKINNNLTKNEKDSRIFDSNYRVTPIVGD